MTKESSTHPFTATVTDIAQVRRNKLPRKEIKIAKFPWLIGRQPVKSIEQSCQIIPFPNKP